MYLPSSSPSAEVLSSLSQTRPTFLSAACSRHPQLCFQSNRPISRCFGMTSRGMDVRGSFLVCCCGQLLQQLLTTIAVSLDSAGATYEHGNSKRKYRIAWTGRQTSDASFPNSGRVSQARSGGSTSTLQQAAVASFGPLWISLHFPRDDIMREDGSMHHTNTDIQHIHRLLLAKRPAYEALQAVMKTRPLGLGG